MNKIHWIRDRQSAVYPKRIITHCGKEGWADGVDEFLNQIGTQRFEAHEQLGKVNCGSCLKSAARIKNSPWGCRRS